MIAWTTPNQRECLSSFLYVTNPLLRLKYALRKQGSSTFPGVFQLLWRTRVSNGKTIMTEMNCCYFQGFPQRLGAFTGNLNLISRIDDYYSISWLKVSGSLPVRKCRTKRSKLRASGFPATSRSITRQNTCTRSIMWLEKFQNLVVSQQYRQLNSLFRLGGGEYNVQTGFGWSNGVILDLLNTYYDRIQAPPPPDNSHAKDVESGLILPALALFNIVLTLIWNICRLFHHHHPRHISSCTKCSILVWKPAWIQIFKQLYSSVKQDFKEF